MTATIRYWLFDDDKQRALSPRSTLDQHEAHALNRQGYGVFFCPNLLRGAVRRIEQLVGVSFAFVDVDGIETRADKHVARERLESAPCAPCRIVETRSGFHAYWRIDGLDLAHWDAVVRWRLVPSFDADPRAADPVRVLRVPGFQHMKRRDDPFPVRAVRRTDDRHSLRAILDAFPEVKPAARPSPAPRPIAATDADDIITAVGNLDARAALERLSGSSLVRGEVFTFRPTSRGRYNIVCDGRATSCFVDERGRIGGGGGLGAPTATQWIAYYFGRVVTTSDWRAIANELRRIFPELVRSNRHAA